MALRNGPVAAPDAPGGTGPMIGGRNLLLSTLPATVHSRLRPHLHDVSLRKKDVLFRAYEPLETVYFPIAGVVSLVSRVESGETLDVGLVGRDGIVGTAVLPGVAAMSCDAIVQIPGPAQRMRADVLRREVLVDDVLASLIARFAQVLLARTMQMSVCNAFHHVEQRCIRWLLAINDLTGGKEIPLTHELLATMLGVRRPTVTLVIRSLHRAGLVVERRGHLMIRDRVRLEAASCECYGRMRDEERRLLGY